MGQLDNAKQILAKKGEEASQLEAIVNPGPKQKKNRLPLDREINMIENILNDKLRIKKKIMQEKASNEAKAKYAKETNNIHAMAVELRQNVQKLADRIEKESKGAMGIGSNSYDGYWGGLPETIKDAIENNAGMIRIKDDNVPIIDKTKAEIDEHVLNIKLGLAPLSDVKILLDKIASL